MFNLLSLRPMNKIKQLLLFVCIAGCFAACKKDSAESFDAEAQYQADTTAIRAFVKANNIDAKKDVSGVFYQVLDPGTGTVTPTATSKVTAGYEGKLLNGTVFDSSASFGPFTFNQVIAGWGIGLPYIKKGGKIRLIIPSYFGYGNQAVGKLPSNAILDFTITLNDLQ
jgi:FKBP-type peptidyl-prolyl cis-trans isomerase FkpA